MAELIRGQPIMTAEAQRAVIKKLIEQHTREATADKQKARASLIKEGVYTSEGKLTDRYGGKQKSSN